MKINPPFRPFGLPLMMALPLFSGPMAPAATADSGRPNILFIILDDWNMGHAGAYGARWVKTPNFDRVAREGILFNHCYTSSPKCSPSRASMLTGRNIWQLEAAANHNGVFPANQAVFPDLLERAGYTIGLGGKGWAPGDYKSTGWTRNPAGPAFNEFERERPTTGISRNDYARNFEAFLAQRPAGKPFSYWMGIFEPHRAYEPNSGRRFGKSPADIPVPPFLPDVETVRNDLADYAVEVEAADAQIGRALQALEAIGELDRTVIVITSDNGMPFPYVKGQIHEDGYRLPLAIRWPGVVRPGRVAHDFINVRDFAPTFLAIAGLEPHPQMTGRSLLPLLRRTAPDPTAPSADDFMLTGKERHDLGRPHDWGYPVRAIRTGEFLYVRNYFPDRWPAGNPETNFPNADDGPTKQLILRLGGHYFDLSLGKRPADELYHLTNDPAGIINLANDPAYAEVMTGLRNRMLQELRREQDPRALGHGNIFDTYPYSGSRNSSYDTWLKKQEQAAKPSAQPIPGS